jgi:fibronectin type 3 domain-containing protein
MARPRIVESRLGVGAMVATVFAGLPAFSGHGIAVFRRALSRRSSRRIGVLACLVLVLALMPEPAAATGSPTPCAPVAGQPSGGSPRLMVVGDSISQGSSGDYTWRYRLYEHLVANGLTPQMVGPYNWLFNNVTSVQGDCTYADPVFETAHDAVWGRMLADEMATIQAEVGASQPDYLLVLIGINDLAFGRTDVPGTEANLKTFVANARAANPNLRIVLGDLLPKLAMTSTLASAVTQYNTDLPTIASQLSTASSPVVVVDDASAIDPSADLWDGTHPNANGEVKIAAGFANALASDFGLGSAYPTPYPTLPIGPQVAPQLSVTPGNGQAVLSWTLSPGANLYYVWQQDVTSGQQSFTELPYGLPPSSDPWTASLLAPGGNYQYKLQAFKGFDGGAFSNVVTVTPTGTAPAAPTGLTATAGDGQAVLSWTPAANATGYYVYVEDQSAGETSFTKLPYAVPGSSWTAGDLVDGATYQFELQSVDGMITGGTTAPVQVTPTGPTPAAPTGLTATAGDGQAVLSWTPAANATGYYVYVENVTAGETSFTKLPYPVSGSTWTAGALVNGATYDFELQSINGLIAGGTSAAVQVTPTAPPPAAPTGLAASAGYHSAKLTWTPAADATGYYVLMMNQTAGDTGFTKLPYPVSGSTWTAGALENGATYQFELQSVDGLILGATTGAVTVQPTGPAPAAPPSLTATAGDSKAILTWAMPRYATCVYILQREVSPASSDFARLPYPVCGDEFTAGGLVDGATYQYEVQAYDDLIAGGTSAAATVTPLGPAPAGPENLTAIPGNQKVTLHWNQASQATSYYIWQKQDTFGVDWGRLPYPVSGDTFVGGDLVNGAQYEYKVQSVDGLQPGGFSNTVTVTAAGPTPEAPGDLAGWGSWQGTANLTWSTTSTATGYYVYLNGTQLPYPVSGGSWTAGDLVPGQTYSFQLQAVNGLQRGDWSNVASITIPLPPAPTGLSGSVAGANEVHLTWDPVWGADGYYIHMNDTTAGSGWTRLPLPVTGTSFTAGYLASGDTYQFAVTAEKYGAESGFSNTVSARPLPPMPTAPANLTVDSIGAHDAVLSWTETSPDVLFQIYQRDVTMNGAFQPLLYPLFYTRFDAGLLAAGHTYEFYVVAQNLAGTSPASNTVTVGIPDPGWQQYVPRRLVFMAWQSPIMPFSYGPDCGPLPSGDSTYCQRWVRWMANGGEFFWSSGFGSSLPPDGEITTVTGPSGLYYYQTFSAQANAESDEYCYPGANPNDALFCSGWTPWANVNCTAPGFFAYISACESGPLNQVEYDWPVTFRSDPIPGP